MQVTVKLFAHFRRGRFKEARQLLPEGSSCRDVLAILGLEPGEPGIMMVNSRHARLDHVLQDEDVLAIFPLIGGG